MATHRAHTTTARERARAAQAQLRAKDRERQGKIERAQMEWFAAAERLEAARADIAKLEGQQQNAIGTLLDLGESLDRVASLCDVEEAVVRSVQRRRSRQPKAAESTAETA